MTAHRTFRCILALLALASLAWADLPIPANPQWQPVSDEVYLQEVGRQVKSDTPLTAVAVFGGKVYVGTASGVRALDGDRLVDADGPRAAVRKLQVSGDRLWALCDDGLWRLDGSWALMIGGDYRDVCSYLDGVVVASAADLFYLDGDILEKVTDLEKLNDEPAAAPILALAPYQGTLYVLHADRVALLQERRFNYVDVADWGSLPLASTPRDMRFVGNRLLVATDKGLGVLRGMTWTALKGEDGLPYEDTTCLAAGFDGDYWVGTSRGAVRATNGEYHYFAGTRWLPGERVNAIACGERIACIATDAGLGIIEYEPYTLLKKAAWYERWLEEWGQKRLGFTHKLEWDNEQDAWVREVSDNDVGWSTHYLAAQCFKYAVTKDPKAREEAVNFFNTMKWSEEITGIPGYPARSIWAVGERGHQAQHGSGGLPAEWHATADGVWQWKGDTSSDEIDAHFYAAAIFYELAAQGDEKARALEHVSRLMSHLIDNGWVLRDVDGKPTRWGRWDPEYFASKGGFYARGLNGLEALSFATTAYGMTGNEKFRAGLDQLLAWDYHREVLRQKLVFPPDDVFESDDRLAFYVYFPLLVYARDPELRAIYLRSLGRSWEIERIEADPWFNFIYGALTGYDCEALRAVRHLREWPLDCLNYVYRNSHRADLRTPEGYKSYVVGPKPISPRERGPHRWVDSTLALDGGSGAEVVDPSGWLDAYWMGRYYGMILPPDTADPKLTTVDPPSRQLGAAPYDGPPRP